MSPPAFGFRGLRVKGCRERDIRLRALHPPRPLYGVCDLEEGVKECLRSDPLLTISSASFVENAVVSTCDRVSSLTPNPRNYTNVRQQAFDVQCLYSCCVGTISSARLALRRAQRTKGEVSEAEEEPALTVSSASFVGHAVVSTCVRGG